LHEAAISINAPTKGIVIPQAYPRNDDGPRQPPRRGALCFGCCCDMRRAVIIVSLLSVVFALLSIPTTSYAVNYWNKSKEQWEEDTEYSELVRQLDGTIKKHRTQMIAFISVSVFSAICGLVGAAKFLAWPVYVPILWYAASTILEWVFSAQIANEYQEYNVGVPVFSLAVSTAVACLFIYPHVGFVREVRRGIMTKENYPNAQASCCCV